MEVTKPTSEEFGKGNFVGYIMNNQSFFELPPADQARLLGQRCGCPVVEELIDKRGPDKMIDRYGEVNFWYGYLAREMEQLNKPLYEKFVQPVERRDDEKPGWYEPQSVPENYTEVMAPINALPAFALPRLLIDHIGSGDQKEIEQRMVSGLSVVEDAMKSSRNAFELLAKTAEGFAQGGDDRIGIIQQILGQGWVKEHNAYSMVGKAKSALRTHAPSVWSVYRQLSFDDKDEHKLVY